MNLLLDTHVFLWWINDTAIPKTAEAAIRHPENTVWISAASAWEITIKVSLGKLKISDRAARFVEDQRLENAFGWLPIDIDALDWECRNSRFRECQPDFPQNMRLP